MLVDLNKYRKLDTNLTSTSASRMTKSYTNRTRLSIYLSKQIRMCNFDGVRYKVGPNPNPHGNGEMGILFYVGDKWTWSWHNTLTTHYTSHLLICESFNKLCKKHTDWEPITNFEMETNLESVLSKWELMFNLYRDSLFTPISTRKDSAFWDMFFACQKTWDKSVIDEIKFIRSCFIVGDDVYKSLERGDSDDIRGGVDFTVNNQTYQHKTTPLISEDGLYIIKSYFDKNKHRKVEFLIVEDGPNFYKFDIKNMDEDSYYEQKTGEFYLTSDRLMEQGEFKNDEMSSLLYEIHLLCLTNRVPFNFLNDEDCDNTVSYENGEVTLKICDLMSSDLINELLKLKEELLNVFN